MQNASGGSASQGTSLLPSAQRFVFAFGRQIMKNCELIHHGANGTGLSCVASITKRLLTTSRSSRKSKPLWVSRGLSGRYTRMPTIAFSSSAGEYSDLRERLRIIQLDTFGPTARPYMIGTEMTNAPFGFRMRAASRSSASSS